MPADPEATRQLLAGLWQKSLPATQEKLALLQRAANAARAATLTRELRHQAANEAHKLAGSLGMFGYPRGTDLARALEQHLDRDGNPDPAFLKAKVEALYTELNLTLAP